MPSVEFMQKRLASGQIHAIRFFTMAQFYDLAKSGEFDHSELKKLHELGLLLFFGKEEPGKRKRKSVAELLAA